MKYNSTRVLCMISRYFAKQLGLESLSQERRVRCHNGIIKYLDITGPLGALKRVPPQGSSFGRDMRGDVSGAVASKARNDQGKVPSQTKFE